MQRKLNESFFKEYCTRFSDQVVSDFFENHESVNGKEILTITPSKQVNFFILKILFTSWQDEMKRLESPYFNFKDVEVRNAMVAFMNLLSQKIEIKKSDFTPLVDQAVKETLLILVNPAEYVNQEFSSKGLDKVSDKTIKTFLKYVRVYKEEFEDVMAEGRDLAVEDFSEIITDHFEDIDFEEELRNQLDFLSEVLPISVSQLFETEDRVVDQFEEEDEEVLEEEPIDFLEDEDIEEPSVNEGNEELDKVEDTHEEEIEKTEDETVEASEMDEEPADFSARMEEDEVESENEEEENRENSEPISANRDEEEYSSETSKRLVYDDSSDDDSFQDELEEETIEEEDVSEEDSIEAQDTEQEALKTVNDRFEEPVVATVSDKLQQSKIANIMDAISINNRYLFTKVLFDGEKEAFAEAIDQIEACDSFDDAVEMIVHEHAKARDWDMNSEEVKELLKVVFRRFR